MIQGQVVIGLKLAIGGGGFLCAHLKPGGGYVFDDIRNIQYGVLPENVVALYDAVYEYGFYA